VRPSATPTLVELEGVT